MAKLRATPSFRPGNCNRRNVLSTEQVFPMHTATPSIPAAALRDMLAAVGDPATEIDVGLNGFPGWMSLPPRWRIAQPPQREHLFYFVAAGAYQAQLRVRECVTEDDAGGERTLRIEAGQLLWVPAGVPFEFWLPEGDTVQVYRFRIRVTSSGAKAYATPTAFRFSPAWPAQAWARQIADEAGHRDPLREQRLRGLLLCLFTELARLLPEGGRTRLGRSANGLRRLTRDQQEILARYFASRAADRPTPGDLAAQLCLSPDYFTRMFRSTFGCAPRAWMVRQRVQLAALRLAESRLSVSEVADEFGYESIFSFSRQFKSVLGVGPARYRAQGGEA